MARQCKAAVSGPSAFAWKLWRDTWKNQRSSFQGLEKKRVEKFQELYRGLSELRDCRI
jgi:hypothetical protein